MYTVQYTSQMVNISVRHSRCPATLSLACTRYEGHHHLYWRERGWLWSHISRHEESMEFYYYLLWQNPPKTTLYHVVNKSVWADIGAASTCSTNILVLQTFYNFKNFVDFLNVCSPNILVLTGLQHQYIGAVQGESKCLQHHTYSVKRCLFNQLE